MKLIALDLDGTLFNNQSQISKENIKAIKRQLLRDKCSHLHRPSLRRTAV